MIRFHGYKFEEEKQDKVQRGKKLVYKFFIAKNIKLVFQRMEYDYY